MAQLMRWSIWHQGEPISEAVEYQPPDVAINLLSYSAGAMDGAQAMDGGLQPLTATLRIRGATSGITFNPGFRLLAPARFVVCQGFRSGGNTIRLEDEIYGWVSSVTPDATGENDRAKNSTSVTLQVTTYCRRVDGKEKLFLIPAEGVRRLDGIDMNNLLTGAVFLCSLENGIDDAKSLVKGTFNQLSNILQKGG
ncbi:phage major tail tube protein [Salmonella enterica subsp. enterica serovar Saintpaul]|nr:phage major tail tube protein [Salmonella enterica subsp. enterica serovar Saintpaul]